MGGAHPPLTHTHANRVTRSFSLFRGAPRRPPPRPPMAQTARIRQRHAPSLKRGLTRGDAWELRGRAGRPKFRTRHKVGEKRRVWRQSERLTHEEQRAAALSLSRARALPPSTPLFSLSHGARAPVTPNHTRLVSQPCPACRRRTRRQSINTPAPLNHALSVVVCPCFLPLSVSRLSVTARARPG